VADANPPAPEPPAADDNRAPWEQAPKKFEGKVPGGPTTGWHDSRPKERVRKPQIAMAVVLFFSLAGVVFALFWFIEPKPKDVVFHGLPVYEYGKIDWAANPSALRDAEELLAQFPQAVGLGSASQQGDKFRDQLRDLDKARGEKGADLPFVLFVSAMSVVRDQRVFILPGDARLDGTDPAKTWIPLDDILKAMDACGAQHKALLLDIAKSPADPFRGPLFDDNAAAIDAQITEFKPAYPVLVSCSPGERSLVIPELQLSAFAAFISEGLTGEADGYREGESPDKKITFAEVSDFTIARVSQWSFDTGRRQVPKLYGPHGNDFRMFTDRTRKGPPPEDSPPAPPPEPKPYPPELLAAWKIRDEQLTLGRLLAPDLIMELESRLLPAEARYLNGFDIEAPQRSSTWDTVVSQLKTRTTLWRTLKASSLAELRVGRTTSKPELVKELERWYRLMSPKPDDAGKFPPPPLAEIEKSEAELEKWLENDQILDGIQYLWQRLLDEPTPTPLVVARVAAMLDRPPFRRLREPEIGKDYTTNEILLVKRIAKSELPSNVKPDTIRTLLQAEQAFGEALVDTGGPLPEGFVRVKPWLEQADERKQRAEAAIFAAEPSNIALSGATEDLRNAVKLYRSAADGAKAFRKAREVVAEAAWRLQASLPSMVALEQPKLAEWQRAASSTTALATQLATDGPFDSIAFDKLGAATKDVQERMKGLALHSPDELKTLKETARLQPEVSTLGRLQLLLSGPILEASDRAALAGGFRKVSHARYWNERAKFEKEHVTKPVLTGPKWEPALERARRRASASFDLLRLSGASTAELDPALATAAAEPARWQALTDKNLEAWQARTPDAAQKSPRTLERILRAAPPRPDPSLRETGFGNLFASEEVERRNWLSGRYGRYGKLRSVLPEARSFYATLAEHCDGPLVKVGR
jgi:hypothetical protein